MSATSRVSFAEFKPSNDDLFKNKGEDVAQSHSRSASIASRRSSMPLPRTSIVDDDILGLGEDCSEDAQVADDTTKTTKNPSRRASVATGMLSAPFQRTPKEAPRWRPYTFEAQKQQKSDDSQTDSPIDAVSEQNKTINQRIFEKTAVSLALGFFVVGIALIVGSILKVILRVDLGIIAFWLNQAFIMFIYLIDKRPESEEREQRKDRLDTFEISTIVCQVLPMLYVLVARKAFTYTGVSTVVVLQVIFKLGLMLSMGKVVDISL